METVLRELRLPFELLALGLIVIVVVWSTVALARTRKMPRRAAVTTSVAEALLAASMVAIVAFTVVPLRITTADQYIPGLGVNWQPVIPILQGLLSDEGDIAAFNAIGNLALYIPLGAAVAWRYGSGLRSVLVLALIVSVVIEAWQVVVPGGRSADVNDVLLNVLGAIIGAAGMSSLVRVAPNLEVRPRPKSGPDATRDRPA